MTLTSEINRVQYSGDGAQTAFPITFVFWLDADIQAVHTDANGTETIWVDGVQFTLTGGSGATGTLTVMTSPTDYTPATNTTLTISSNLDDTQDTSLPEGGPFPSSSVEQQLDKIVRLIQQKAEQLGRALKLPISSANTGLEIPDPSASQFLRWNSGATALENADITGSGSIGVPVTVAEGGTNATTAAAAVINLGAQADLDVPSQAEAEAGTATTERVWTAERVKQAIGALATDPVGAEDLWVPAGAMISRATSGAASGLTETTSNKQMIRTFDFDAATDEYVQFPVAFPERWNAGTVTFQPYWTAASGSGGVAWFLQGRNFLNDTALDTGWGTGIGSVDTLITVDDLHIGPESAAITIAGAADAGMANFQIHRDVSDAGDTLGVDAKLIGVKLTWTSDAGTDD